MSSKDLRSPRSPDDFGSCGSFRSPKSPRPQPFTPRTIQSPDDLRSPDCPRSPDCDPGSPSRGPRSPDDPRSPDELGSSNGPRSPDDNRQLYSNNRSPRSPPSPQSPSSPPLPQRIRSPNYLNSTCPRSISPPPSPQSPPPDDRGIGSPLISEKGGHLSDSDSDDGRSNISSSSSFDGSSRRVSVEKAPEKKAESSSKQKKSDADLQNHAEDLSDVSELGSLESVSDDEGNKKNSIKVILHVDNNPSSLVFT